MSVRFDTTAAKYLSRAASMNSAGWTLMAWVYFVDAPAAGGYYGVFFKKRTAWEDACEFHNLGGVYHLTTWEGGVEKDSVKVLAVTTWYHVCLVRESVTVMKLYIDGAYDHTSGATNSAALSGQMQLGTWNAGAADAANSRMECSKAWNAALTAAEVAQEYLVRRPVRTDNLYLWTPNYPGATERAVDMSGLAHSWTENGALTDEQSCPASWGAGIWAMSWKGAALPARTANLAVTLADVSLAATATNNIAGTLNQTLAAVTLAGTGNVPIVGTLAQTLAPVTLAGVGTSAIDGSLTKMLAPVTIAGSATVSIAGSLSQTLSPVTLAGTGTLAIIGSLAQTLDPVTVAGTGLAAITANLSQTLNPVTLAGTGLLPITGALNIGLDPVTVAGIGLAAIAGQLIVTLDPVTLLGLATVAINASLSTTLGPVTLAGGANTDILGSLALTISPVTLVGSGQAGIVASLDQTMGPVTLNAAGLVGIVGALNFTLAPVQVYALGSTLTTSFACAVASFAPVEVRAELTAPVYDASGAVSVYLATLSGEVYSATPVPESIRSTWEVECHQTL